LLLLLLLVEQVLERILLVLSWLLLLHLLLHVVDNVGILVGLEGSGLEFVATHRPLLLLLLLESLHLVQLALGGVEGTNLVAHSYLVADKADGVAERRELLSIGATSLLADSVQARSEGLIDLALLRLVEHVGRNRAIRADLLASLASKARSNLRSRIDDIADLAGVGRLLNFGALLLETLHQVVVSSGEASQGLSALVEETSEAEAGVEAKLVAALHGNGVGPRCQERHDHRD